MTPSPSLIFAALLVACTPAWAQPIASSQGSAPFETSQAQAIAELRARMKPTTDFDKWVADQLTHYVSHCAALAKTELPAHLRVGRLYRPGTWALPRDTAASREACVALASTPAAGLTPACGAFNSRQPPFSVPRAGLPADYAFFERVVQDGEGVNVGGYCWLVQGVPSTRQFFAGPAKVQILGAPTSTAIQTGQGEVTLKTSSIKFQVDGLPDTPAVLAVWP